MLGKRMIGAAALVSIAMGFSAFEGSAQPRERFNHWYGVTGQLGGVMAGRCKRFNESKTPYQAVCTGQGAYDRAEQNTIAAYRARMPRFAICTSPRDVTTFVS